jgi:hypothetical protein
MEREARTAENGGGCSTQSSLAMAIAAGDGRAEREAEHDEKITKTLFAARRKVRRRWQYHRPDGSRKGHAAPRPCGPKIPWARKTTNTRGRKNRIPGNTNVGKTTHESRRTNVRSGIKNAQRTYAVWYFRYLSVFVVLFGHGRENRTKLPSRPPTVSRPARAPPHL